MRQVIFTIFIYLFLILLFKRCLCVSLRRQEGDESVTHVAQHIVELFLGVKPVVLIQGGVVVADVFIYFSVKTVAQRWDHQDGGCHSS